MDETRGFDPIVDGVPAVSIDGISETHSPGARIRALVDESIRRGAPMVSAQAVQARLFAVYDDVSSVPEALALLQRHLGLTLDRNWYSSAEIEALAQQLDALMGASTAVTGADADVVPHEGQGPAGGSALGAGAEPLTA
ncbi:MAG: hypothetical protein M0Z95_14925 [Actinomycetota bacterium]|jgi:hypothetical protein|nr:hypothetical protein [Actinomycetota bacterium]